MSFDYSALCLTISLQSCIVDDLCYRKLLSTRKGYMIRRKIAIAVLGILGVGSMLACTPKEVAIWNSLSPQQQHGLFASSTDCVGEMKHHWPAHLHGWAEKIMWRESRFDASAQNPRSSAAGCFQLMHSLHANKYPADCRDRYNAHCNVRAAWKLYQLDNTAWSL